MSGIVRHARRRLAQSLRKTAQAAAATADARAGGEATSAARKGARGVRRSILEDLLSKIDIDEGVGVAVVSSQRHVDEVPEGL